MKDARILEACLERVTDDGWFGCQDAHLVAAELGISPLEVGHVINAASELRFYRCQLGLFGYGKKSDGTYRIVRAALRIPDDLRVAIDNETSSGQISCASIWAVAQAFKYPRLQVANMVEAMELSIRPCQLGCF